MKSQKTPEIGTRLRVMRMAAGLTQSNAAKECGVTRQAVSLWEKEGRLSADELRGLCVLYGVSSDFILFGMRTVPASDRPVVAEVFRDRKASDAGAGGDYLTSRTLSLHKTVCIESKTSLSPSIPIADPPVV